MKTKLQLTLIILIFVFLSSCNYKNEQTVTIVDFQSEFVDSLIPKKKMIKNGYATFNVEIKGFVNDSIKINLENGKQNTSFFLNGKIDSRFIDEYSGCCPRYIYIYPYKASKGKVEIKYGLY